MLDVTSELNVDELQPARTIIAANKKVSFPFITNQGASLRLPFLLILSQGKAFACSKYRWKSRRKETRKTEQCLFLAFRKQQRA